MIDFVLGFIPGGGLTVLAGSVVAVLGILWRLLSQSKKAGQDQQLVKEAQARARNLEKIKESSDAAGRVKPGNGELSDPRNRDNRR